MKKNLIIIFLIPFLLNAQKNQSFHNNLSQTIFLDVEGGLNYYLGDFPKSKFGFYSRGGIEYFFNSKSKGLFGIKSNIGYGKLQGFGNNSLNIGEPPRLSSEFSNYFFDAKIGLSYLLNFGNVLPYLTIGGHSNFWYKVLDENGNEVYDKKRLVNIGYLGEIGLKIILSDGLTLNLVGIISSPNSDELDGYVSSKKDIYLSGLAGFSIYFGGKKDSDQDGVIDDLDLCPSTPTNVTVDKYGCPIDSDLDGVPDYLDKCPDTPLNVVVNNHGCPEDSDLDGVPDYQDRCPGTPINVKVDSKGCPLDSDKDGVPDYLDKCENTPPDVIVDNDGCPVDTDLDGVPDYLDKCPDTPLGELVTEEGCPVPTPEISEVPTEKVEQFFVLQGMTTFEKGSSKLTNQAKMELKKLAELMMKYPDASWRIEGHTDSQGSEIFNKKLSQQRADAVKNYLIELGIPSSKLIAEGMGENYPLADNTTEEGRQKNRRVVIAKIK